MSNQSSAKLLIEQLNQKSFDAIQAAKKIVLGEKFSSESVNQVIQRYITKYTTKDKRDEMLNTATETAKMMVEIVAGRRGNPIIMENCITA